MFLPRWLCRWLKHPGKFQVSFRLAPVPSLLWNSYTLRYCARCNANLREHFWYAGRMLGGTTVEQLTARQASQEKALARRR